MRAGRSLYWQNYFSRPLESPLIRKLAGVALLLHLLLIFYRPNLDIYQIEQANEMDSIEADLVFEGGESLSGLQGAREAEQLKVQKQILPQLPKSYVVEDQAEESSDTINPDRVAKSDEEIKDNTKIAKDKEKDERRFLLERKRREALQNLKLKEILERKMKEEARLKKEFADRNEAQKNITSILSKAQEKLRNKGGSGNQVQIFRKLIKRRIAEYYELPKTYENFNGKLITEVTFKYGPNGYGQAVIQSSSGDGTFDNLVIAAASRAIAEGRLPKPPGPTKVFVVKFTP